MLGREVRIPLDLFSEAPETKGADSFGEYITGIKKEMARVGDLIRNNFKRPVLSDMEEKGLRPHFTPYQVGQAVFFKNEKRRVGQNPKLQYPYEGPFIITKKLSDLNYEIQVSKKGKSRVVHYEKIKNCKATVPTWIKKKQEELKTPD
jgi:hypothetical protein